MAATAVTRPPEPGMLERWFKLRENATTVGNEVIGGITTFFVMAYIIALNPIILGGGTPLFKPGEKRKLKLVDSRPLTNGIVILRYVPAAAK